MPSSCFVADHSAPTPVDLVPASAVEAYLEAHSEYAATVLRSEGFAAKAGELVRLPDMTGNLSRIVFGVGDNKDALCVAKLSASLKEGVYRFDYIPEDCDPQMLAVAWADGAYKFDRYLSKKHTPPQLVIADEAALEIATNFADAIHLLRDLVNTPAQDMTPEILAGQVADLAEEFGADLTVTAGDDLVEANFPLVHAVGRAAADAPRVIELSWGNADHPKLALVGKGITYDTGGLDIKTGGYMRLMKKDMGGSAHAIALARLVMSFKLPVRLKLVVPAAENAIGAGAFRPGDVLTSRKGLTVEIDNTDAEGRLVLADALVRAQEEGDPDLLIDFATLTGAARVALGPEVAPFYTPSDDVANAIAAAAEKAGDPAWRMPLWEPYYEMLSSPIADMKNSASGPMGGSITAALFLKKFVETENWVHWDVWAWRNAKYGNSEGAAAQGLRAMIGMLSARYKA